MPISGLYVYCTHLYYYQGFSFFNFSYLIHTIYPAIKRHAYLRTYILSYYTHTQRGERDLVDSWEYSTHFEFSRRYKTKYFEFLPFHRKIVDRPSNLSAILKNFSLTKQICFEFIIFDGWC